jgi:molybdopterin converting factor small subunit
VEVRYGAIFREAAGISSERVELADLRLGPLIAEVSRRHPGRLTAWLIDPETERLSQNVLFIVNGVTVRGREQELAHGDIILLLPAVGGG